MGSTVEINDTLQITAEQGFPAEILDWEKHQKNPISFEIVKDKIFEFYNKSGARLFHSPPTRCWLVHNINGKWLYWGHVLILEQTIKTDELGNVTTSGKFKIIKLYAPEYQQQITQQETSAGKSYF